MLPGKLTIFCTFVLVFSCAIQDSVSQKALGRFNDLPLNCYSCTGADCITSFGRIGKCNGKVNQACATVFGADGAVVARGCSDEVAEVCNEATNTCYYCESSACNEATSRSEYVECISCDTETDKNCLYDISKISNKRQCLGGCITALYPRNKQETDPAYELARTCLDDLDLDDRDICESGENKDCKSCTGANCNTDKIPETPRLKCYTCEEDCADFESLECPAYRENDQCFTEFDNDNEIVRMGCRSSLERDYESTKKRSIYYCMGDDCNVVAPVPLTCASCSSADDITCITNTFSVSSKKCQRFPYTQCATYMTADGIVVRDCVYDVPEDDLFDKCLSSDNTECAICTNNNCNKEAFPADRLSCLQCDSSIDPTCDTGLSTASAGYCPIYTADDVCVTQVENGITRRGCQSQLSCDPKDTNNCRTCTGANCNTVNLIKNQVGEPGKWQDLPLSCYTCTGAECLSNLGSSLMCSGNNIQNCMTVFGVDGKVSARGCSDAVLLANKAYCDANDENCFACKSNNCNNALQKSEFIDCYFCDSADISSCVSNYNGGRTRKCKGACMVALYPSTLSESPAYELVRSCLDDKEVTDQTTCQSGSDANCIACSTGQCNKQNLPDNRLSCYTCDDESCATQTVQTCRTYQPDDQCYISYNKSITNVLSMGCRSELPADTIETLTKAKNFWVCEGNNCNNLASLPTATSCLVCNSLTDKRCIANPSAMSTFETCVDVPYVECMTRVRADGITERGCLSTLEDESFYNCLKDKDDLCKACNGKNCNAVSEFPANRLRCQQCNGETDSNCAAAPNSLDVCPLYTAEDACVTTIQNSFTVRGCVSSVQCANSLDTSACRICNTIGCNTVNLEKNYQQGAPGRWQSVPISCYTCSDAASCAAVSTAVQCTNNVNQQCFTVFNLDGQVIQRGCKDEVLNTQQTYCDQNSERCLGCNSNSCNNVNAFNDYVDCLFCDTERDGNCVNSVTAITTTRKCNKKCVTALYPRFNETDAAYGLSRSCLDDLEAEDQKACEDGTKQNCAVCTGAKCNTVAIPEIRLSCYHCNGDDCAAPTQQQCAQYREKDVCYTQYDETATVTRLGCRSDFSNENANYLVSQKYLITCDGENCNNKDVVPSTYTCSLCNSRTDENCASNPDKIIGATKCEKLPYTNCYTRVSSDGATERGCASSLEDEVFLKCLMGQDEYCQVCTGDNCNKKLYPTPRLACHVCDSSKDKNCQSNPNQLTICPIYDKNQQCVSTFSNGITYRGCSAELLCDTASGNACQTCAEDGCNTADVSKASDTNYGKWQDLPLSCWACTGIACLTSSTEKKCANNNEQDCVTVFDDTGAVVRRGCSDEVKADETYGAWCIANPDKCFNCKSNKCNSATQVNEFTSCVYCDSSSDPNCLYQVLSVKQRRQCQGGCMTALYAASTSENPSYELIRTCLNDKETIDQQACSDKSDIRCQACNTADCNYLALPNSRLSCFQCSGEDCADPVSKVCPLYKPNDQCYTLFDETNSVAQLGCASSLMSLTFEEIVATKRTLLCDGMDCNSYNNIPQKQECISCDSKEDPNCATNAYVITTYNTCTALPYTNCYSLLVEDGTTQRGCVSDLEENIFVNCVLNKDGKCEACEGDGCNRKLFPANRLQCYTCNSNADANCEQNPTELAYCSLFNDQTSCATALMGNVTVRGCSDDVLCDSNDRTTCQLCKASGCNNKDIKNQADEPFGVWQDLPLKCYTCSGEQCLSSLGVSQTCDTNMYQDCMTVFDVKGNVTRRGCSDAVESLEAVYCSQNPSKCFKCKSNECNIAWKTTEYVNCLSCNSDKDPFCAERPENVPFDTRACYKSCMVAQKGDSIIRSCLDDKEILDQSTCAETNYDGCASCQGNGCNDFVFPRAKLSCHICNNRDCTSSVSKDCEYSLENDNFCIAKYENNKPKLLGCASDQNTDDLFTWAQENILYSCMTSDCNSLQLLPTPNTCVSCNSTAQCAQNPDQVTERVTCNALIPECYSLITEKSETARGCISDLDLEQEYTCTENGSCSTCKTANCNSKVYPEDRRRCYVCSSATDSRCTQQVSSTGFSQVCELYDKNDLCITRVVNGQIERGCSSSIDCNINDNKSCAKCDGNNCNTAELTGDCDDVAPTTTTPSTTVDPNSGTESLSIIPSLLLACLTTLLLSQ